jgi:hypothetical protein
MIGLRILRREAYSGLPTWVLNHKSPIRGNQREVIRHDRAEKWADANMGRDTMIHHIQRMQFYKPLEGTSLADLFWIYKLQNSKRINLCCIKATEFVTIYCKKLFLIFLPVNTLL